ncbi:MAG: vWA domain-containing protein [Planctomycetota bacterium]|jgi:hypothetical protein
MTTELNLLVPIAVAVAVVLFVSLTEWLHVRRMRRAGALAFGPSGKPRGWVNAVPFFRAACLSGMAWALTFLCMASPVTTESSAGDEPAVETGENLILLWDFSPSMALLDAGAEGEISRKERMQQVMGSMVDRLGRQVRYSLICFYARPMPIVERAYDKAVVYNVLNDLPVEKAMEAGKTDLAAAVNASLKMAEEYPDGSTTLVIVTDGDTIEMEEIRPLPKSIKKSLVLGVGNPREGISIDGHMSRQDPVVLGGLARQLRGDYRDVNIRGVSSFDIGHLCQGDDRSGRRQWSLADVALALFIVLSCLYAFLPVSQELYGTDWKPVGNGALRGASS